MNVTVHSLFIALLMRSTETRLNSCTVFLIFTLPLTDSILSFTDFYTSLLYNALPAA